MNREKKKKMSLGEDKISLGDFYEAYMSCRKHKRNTVNALLFERNYENNLINLWEDVNTKTYTIGKSIAFIVTHPKIREVFAADFRDRIVHHIIMQRLEPLFENKFIEDCYSSRKEKGVLYGVNRLYSKIDSFTDHFTREDCWIGKFDIKGFFMGINRKILWNNLDKFILDKYKGKDIDLLRWLVELVIFNRPNLNCRIKSKKSLWKKLDKDKSLFTCDQNCGLPIGNLTSQCFANFYLSDFDDLMSSMFQGNYGRYVDDFFVLGRTKEEILDRISFIKKWLLDNLGLRLHDKKLYLQNYRKGVKFIGSVIKSDRIYYSKQSLGGLYSMIHDFNMAPINIDTAEYYTRSLNSYLGFLKHKRSYNLRLKIKKMIDYRKWNGVFYWSKNLDKVTLYKRYNKQKRNRSSLKDNGASSIF
jgi:RNA-directed DNA polymerase